MRALLTTSLALAGLCAFGCAYPRHDTLMQTVPNPPRASSELPRGMYSMRLMSADAVQGKISGLPWDDDGTEADPFVRLIVDNRLVWQSEVIRNTSHPQWDAMSPRNIVIPSDSQFRIELWDWDSPISADPMGHLERRGLPTNAPPGAEARLTLDTTAVITLMMQPPVPHRGLGLTFEARPDYLKVLHVEPFSPAARAGVRVGEHIVAIGPERIAAMTSDEAASALSLAQDRHHKVSLTDADGGREREVTLDGGFLWLVM